MGRGNRTKQIQAELAAVQAAAAIEVADDAPGGPEATREEVEAYLAEHFPHANDAYRQACLDQLADPSYLWFPNELSNGSCPLPTRRALEAVLAHHGKRAADYKRDNAQRPWTEFANEVRRLPAMASLARDLEGAARRGETVKPFADRQRPPADLPDDLAALVAKRGPGQRSGRVEDYTRAELRKVLGYTERDCKHLTNDDLLGMALDAHLVPRFKNAPSHTELAARTARGEPWPDWRRNAFNAAMRTPYGTLANRLGLPDDGRLSRTELRRRLADHHPFLFHRTNIGRDQLEEFAAAAGIPTMRPDSERNTAAEGAVTTYRTPLEAQYADAFTGFVESFGGARKLGSINVGLKGSDGRRVRSCLAFYEPGTGNIHLRSDLAKHLRSRNDDPAAIEDAVSTVAHELFHALEGRDLGSRFTGKDQDDTPQHTLDEGATEALARLHTQDLAERMGLWSGDRGSLRDHARGGSYPREVETTVALAAACCGELDKDKLRAGGYAEPEALSERAQKWLLDLHLEAGPDGRIEQMQDMLRARAAGGPGRPPLNVSALLRECKHSRYQWRRKRVPVLQADGQQVTTQWGTPRFDYEHVAPAKLGDNLADMLEDLGL